MAAYSPVTTATRVAASPQIDGRLAVHEIHQADGGEREERFYLAEEDADLDALLELHSRLFLQRLAAR